MSRSKRGDEVQDLLAQVSIAAAFVRRLRALEGEAQTLLEDAQRNALAGGASQSMIATVAGVSQPRVSEIVAGRSRSPPAALARRLHLIMKWPGDALKQHKDGFSGRMIFPPYGRAVT